ncbi:hypothetical protein GCM10009548_21500 [Streptomyces malaysiensis subsp. malaysiensis]
MITNRSHATIQRFPAPPDSYSQGAAWRTGTRTTTAHMYRTRHAHGAPAYAPPTPAWAGALTHQRPIRAARKLGPMKSDTTRRCTRCHEVKDISEFPVRTVRGVTSHTPRCRDCIREADRARAARYREKNVEKTREADRDSKRRTSARRIGLTTERAEELRAGACGICGRTPDDGCQIYQDKPTGAVLGALCRTCQSGLSMFGGMAERLTAALRFVQSGADLRDEAEPTEP